MAGSGNPRQDLDDTSYLDNDLDESIINSPAKKLPIRNAAPYAHSHSRQTSTTQQQPSIRSNTSNVSQAQAQAQGQHEINLRRELASVRKVNEAIEGVLESLEKAKNNMKNVNRTVNNATSLLNIWTRILSQTEHTQRLILDPTWQGGSQDVADMEGEEAAKQAAVERQEAEEQERREAAAAAKKAAEEERARKAETATAAVATGGKPRPGYRLRGDVTSRGSNTARAGYVTMGGAPSTTTGTTGVGRGTVSTRRTTRGLARGTAPRGSRGRG